MGIIETKKSEPGRGPYAVNRTISVPDVQCSAGHTKRWAEQIEQKNRVETENKSPFSGANESTLFFLI